MIEVVGVLEAAADVLDLVQSETACSMTSPGVGCSQPATRSVRCCSSRGASALLSAKAPGDAAAFKGWLRLVS
jgi:hypothetical protein